MLDLENRIYSQLLHSEVCDMTPVLFALSGSLALVLGSLVWVFKR